jgi:hypothetical protein
MRRISLPCRGRLRYGARMSFRAPLLALVLMLPLRIVAADSPATPAPTPATAAAPVATTVNETDRQAALETVRRNLAAMEKGDLEAMMATIHPESPQFEATRTAMRAFLEQNKFSYEFEKLAVESADDEVIRVGFVQVTRNLGPDRRLPDNRVTGTHILQQDGGQWKIWETEARSYEKLGGAPDGSKGSGQRAGLKMVAIAVGGLVVLWLILRALKVRPNPNS